MFGFGVNRMLVAGAVAAGLVTVACGDDASESDVTPTGGQAGSTPIGGSGGSGESGVGGTTTETGGSGGAGGGPIPGCAGRAPVPATYDYSDHVPPSTSPPGGLSPSEVPMFVVLSWDDNGFTDGMTWMLDTLAARSNPDGTPLRNSFRMVGSFGADADLAATWQRAAAEGHEIGNHTMTHNTSFTTDAAGWSSEIGQCNEVLAGLGIDAVTCFVAPRLEYSDAMFTVLKDHGIWWDCSIGEPAYLHPAPKGATYYWPYTLDDGSPGYDERAAWDPNLESPLPPVPGLWELPLYSLIAPDQYVADFDQRVPWETGGEVDGVDYNMWVDTQWAMTRTEFVDTLIHSFDLRYAGNRAPFHFVGHTDFYAPSNVGTNTYFPNITVEERQQGVEEFLDYVLTYPDVWVVSGKKVIDWMRDPVTAECYSAG